MPWALVGGRGGELLARGGVSEMLLWAPWPPWSYSPWVDVAMGRNLTQCS